MADFESDMELNLLSEKVIGAAIEVHRQLGPGLDEGLYEAALGVELQLRNIRFDRQVIAPVLYKGQSIGQKRLDMVIEGKIVVELKAVEQMPELFRWQTLTYLKITGLRLGLLINFNTKQLVDGIKRIINR
ncbi:MAG TPA: GxxExxY protein [Tepidisphaeraceae bacterium]|nr:GxxExxY protein [Tepidisphaeraceae bacterium]